jgi:hypothetical protein
MMAPERTSARETNPAIQKLPDSRDLLLLFILARVIAAMMMARIAF